MKAILEAIPEFYLIIIGLVVVALMFSIVSIYYPQLEAPKTIKNSESAAKILAEKSIDCWLNHRSGLDRENDICYSVDIELDKVLTEEMFTKYLDCKALPNSLCDDKVCDCKSPDYEDQDKVKWLVRNNETTIKISYDSNNRRISILDVNAITYCEIDADILISCDNNPLLIKYGSIIIFGDLTPLIKSNEEFFKLLNNIAKFFSGEKILIVWEDENSNPDKIDLNGFDVKKIRHTNAIEDFNYDQIWLIRPGWCELRKNEFFCLNTKEWSSEEIDSIKDFVNKGGKLFILTDYGTTVKGMSDTDVINSILKSNNANFEQFSGYECKSSKLKITRHEITEDISQFLVEAVARFDCNA